MTKKIILGITLLTALTSVQARDYNYPTLQDATSYSGKYAPISAPVTFSPDGTIVYQTGLYDDMVMIGDDILENIATSAYLSAVDNKQEKPLWTVGIQGAAHITAVTATSDAVYVTGTFADDIILGSRDLNTATLAGTTLSHDMVNAFMAKYDTSGHLVAAKAILPKPNSTYAGTDTYESDLSVVPTAIAVMGGKAYLSFTYLGGYTVDAISVEGTVKSSFGFWDNNCAAILAASADDLSAAETVADMRNSEAVNTNGMRPQSICLTTDGTALYAAAFACGSTDIAIGAEKQNVSFNFTADEQEYGAILLTLRDGKADIKKVGAANSSRSYVNNKITSMCVSDGNIYLAGHVSTPLPFGDNLVPDLWSDQFAAAIRTDGMTTSWAYITGAKRDDMATLNDKYRESIGAALSGTNYLVVGTTNFSCASSALLPQYADLTCLGVAAHGTLVALNQKTANGSQLAISSSTVGVQTPADGIQPASAPTYDLSGRPVATPAKGQVMIRSDKKYIAQ